MDHDLREGAPRRPPNAPSFRLLRLRMTLVLIGMAFAPVAIVTALAPLRESAHDAEHSARLDRARGALSAELASDLAQARQAVVLLAGDSAVRDALTAGDAGAVADARRRLGALHALTNGLAARITLVDRSGGRRADLRPAGQAAASLSDPHGEPWLRGALALSPADSVQSAPYAADGAWRVSVAAPVHARRGGTAVGVLRLEIALDVLLGRHLPGDGEWTGASIVHARTGQVLAASSSGTSSGVVEDGPSSPVAIASARDLAIVMYARPSDASPTASLAGLLAALVLPLLLAAFWMSRQVLRPALELERSQHELRAMYEHARRDSLRDALTGLGNHRSFQEEFDRQLEHSRRQAAPVSLVLLDVDDFKQVNDAGGHAVGDDLLAEMARLISASLRRTDRAFRIGGDEFAILMPHTDTEAAYAVIRRLLATALQTRPDARFRKPISFSAGISAAPALGQTRAQLYAQADQALYWGKRHGRTSVEIHDPTRTKPSERASDPEASAAVARAAAGRMLRPVYQPIVELSAGAIVGYEGLVRPTAESGFPDPGALFTAAEGSGRTIDLDLACLDVVAEGAAAIPGECLLSLNMSPRTLEAPEFNVSVMLDILARHHVDPARVIVELTEREPVEQFERLRENLRACQRAGIRVAADDVGAGNAGLRLLSQIHFDIVKIDLSLVQGGAAREQSLAVLKSLCDLAGRWGALVIAEGVETGTQLRLLRELNVSAAQGYLLGRPAPVTDRTKVDLETLEQQDDILSLLPASAARPAPAEPAVRSERPEGLQLEPGTA